MHGRRWSMSSSRNRRRKRAASWRQNRNCHSGELFPDAGPHTIHVRNTGLFDGTLHGSLTSSSLPPPSLPPGHRMAPTGRFWRRGWRPQPVKLQAPRRTASWRTAPHQTNNRKGYEAAPVRPGSGSSSELRGKTCIPTGIDRRCTMSIVYRQKTHTGFWKHTQWSCMLLNGRNRQQTGKLLNLLGLFCNDGPSLCISTAEALVIDQHFLRIWIRHQLVISALKHPSILTFRWRQDMPGSWRAKMARWLIGANNLFLFTNFQQNDCCLMFKSHAVVTVLM